MMVQKIQLVMFLVLMLVLLVASDTNNQDFVRLKSLKDIWQNTPPTWEGSDPCGEIWEGIRCTNSRVTSIILPSMGLIGTLSGDIGQFSELRSLDLSNNKNLSGPLPPAIGNLKKLYNLLLVGCSFYGPIPDTLGNLRELNYLSLTSNKFNGRIPPTIGKLSKLYWLDLTDNNLEGPIPISDANTPGLDLLLHTKHFHLGMNKLSGQIPAGLFSSKMQLIHVLFDNNALTGDIPTTLGLVKSLELVRIDRNRLTGNVPLNFNNLIKVSKLDLSNNKLTGPVPNLTGMNLLSYVDISNNSFDSSTISPWFSTLQSLTTLMMEDTQLEGEIPISLFSLPNLESLVLKNNMLNGTLDIGTTYSNQLQLIDVQHNSITTVSDTNYNANLTLVGNPFCDKAGATKSYCKVPGSVSQSDSSYMTAWKNCLPPLCISDQISSPNCKCAHPYAGTLNFRARTFLDWGNLSYYKELESTLFNFFQKEKFPVESVSLRNPIKDSSDYLQISLQVFPYGQDSFNRTLVANLGFVFSSQTYKAPPYFGPYFFIANNYGSYAESNVHVDLHSDKSSKSNIVIVIGAAAGGSVLVILLLLAGGYAFRQKRRVTEQSSRPFANWDPNKSSGSIPQLKGARWFSFEELKKYTNNFSSANDIGSGGYGKVYLGNLPTGELVAVKRAKKESMQGGVEFKTEIELLSRVHHKNVVNLVGFCFEQGEQLLVYDYIPNGTLKDALSGKSGIRLDWIRRLKVARCTARGLAYLHELANPPIIHRDIKSSNVLLDESLIAKVSDFGLSKLMAMGDGKKVHVSTQVKGTMGYLDPEYYMTQQLTEKSDVYSFGVLMLELITARRPIEHGKYIVREVKKAMDRTKELYNLQSLVDSRIGLVTTLKGFDKFVNLAMSCVEELGADSPTMSEVVKEIENIMQLAGLNPNAESASTSSSYEAASKTARFNPYNSEAFDYSGGFPPSMIDPH